MIRKLLLTIIGSVAFTAGAHAQQILTQFTFETSAPTTAGPFNAEVNNTTAAATALGFHAGASTYSSPAGNGSSKSFSSNTWAVGDYYQISVNTTGFSGLFITVGQTGSNTGPANFSLEYSVAGAAFSAPTLFPYTVTNDSWSASTIKTGSEKTFDLSAITSLNDAANVVFRLVDTSTTAISSANPVATAGSSRIDDFYISTGAAVFPVPEPSSYALAAGGLILLGVTQRLRRRAA